MDDRSHELKIDDFWRLSKLFERLRYNLVVNSVIAGHTPAWVYVDDTSQPHVGWIWNRMGTMLLAGDPGRDAFNRRLSRILREEVVPDARSRRIPSLTLHYDAPAWRPEIERLLPEMSAERAWRRFYRFDRLQVDRKQQLPRDASVRRMDGEVLRRGRMQNVSSLLGWVCSFWHTIQDFLETGFGFYLVHDDVIVSWCLTVYAAHGDVELGLATVPQYRNRGYATLTAAASLEQAVEEGLVPHWHCDEDNLASRRVAERVGFANPTHYAVYTFDL